MPGPRGARRRRRAATARMAAGMAAAVTAALALLAGVPAASAETMGSNALITLAGQGRHEELAAELSAREARGKLSAGELHALCWAYSRLKRYGPLFACLDRLEATFRGSDKSTLLFGLDDGTPTVYLMRAEAELDLAQWENALREGRKALEWYRREGGSGEKDVYIDTLAALAVAAAFNGDAAAAAGYARQLDEVSVGWPVNSAFVTVKSFAQARARLALGQYKEAYAALTANRSFELRVALEEFLHGNPPNWIWQQLPRNFMLLRALYGMGRVAEAKAGYDELLKLPQIRQNGGIYWMVLYDRGRIAAGEGDLEEAIRFFRQAIEMIEEQRSSIGTETSKIGFVTDKQAVYGALVGALLGRHRDGEALEYVERAKSRALVDLLAGRTDAFAGGSAPAAARETTALLERQRNAEEKLLEQPSVSDAQALGLQRDTLRSVTRELRRVAPDLASLVAVTPVPADRLEALLGPDETGIEYFQYEDSLFALVFTRHSVRSFSLPARDLVRDIRTFRTVLQRPAEDARPAARVLYDRLLRPLEAAIAGKPLLILPDRALHYLPFAALYDGSRFVVETHSLRVLPSVSVSQFIRKPSASGPPAALILGNPTLDLPGAEAEARGLAKALPGSKLLLGSAATKESLFEQAAKYRLIHIAAHGEFRADAPLQSRLVLAKSAGGGGDLTVNELYGRTLPADLVALSACESGLGRITDGDDVIGLNRGFLYAGASAVLASLWVVSDEATLPLMLHFYENLPRMGAPRALRAAQLELRQRFPAPYYWAAFYLTAGAQ